MSGIENYLSPLELVLLRELWGLGAIGTNPATNDTLTSRTGGIPASELSAALEGLTMKKLITSSDQAGRKSFALTALGISLVRQLQEFDLEKLGKG